MPKRGRVEESAGAHDKNKYYDGAQQRRGATLGPRFLDTGYFFLYGGRAVDSTLLSPHQLPLWRFATQPDARHAEIFKLDFIPELVDLNDVLVVKFAFRRAGFVNCKVPEYFECALLRCNHGVVTDLAVVSLEDEQRCYGHAPQLLAHHGDVQRVYDAVLFGDGCFGRNCFYAKLQPWFALCRARYYGTLQLPKNDRSNNTEDCAVSHVKQGFNQQMEQRGGEKPLAVAKANTCNTVHSTNAPCSLCNLTKLLQSGCSFSLDLTIPWLESPNFAETFRRLPGMNKFLYRNGSNNAAPAGDEGVEQETLDAAGYAGDFERAQPFLRSRCPLAQRSALAKLYQLSQQKVHLRDQQPQRDYHQRHNFHGSQPARRSQVRAQRDRRRRPNNFRYRDDNTKKNH